jgi:chemotaxis protein MotB
MARTRPSSRRSGVKPDTSGAWLTTYADAVTLLMAFFVLLYAMSEVDVIKFTAFLEGLRVPFGNAAGEGLLPETNGLEPDGSPIIPPAPALEASRERTQELVEAVRHRQQANDQLDLVAAALTAALREQGLDQLVEQRREERGLVVSIASDDVLFELGSTRIGAIGREVIAVVSETLDGFPNPIVVEGHTDDLPLMRAGYTNWNLSTDRAVAVLSLMIERHGLPSDRVAAAGYSEYHPLADNTTAGGRARNRRVDIVVLVQESAT